MATGLAYNKYLKKSPYKQYNSTVERLPQFLAFDLAGESKTVIILGSYTRLIVCSVQVAVRFSTRKTLSRMADQIQKKRVCIVGSGNW